MKKGSNGNIIVEPFPNVDVKTQVRSGFATVEQKHTLTKLRVIYGNNNGTILDNAFVYVLAETFKQPFANKVYLDENGTRFIVLPEHFVLMVDNP
jgi:hypothetical protein